MKKTIQRKIEYRKRDKSATKDKILKVTGEVFREVGYQRLTIALVARRAEVDRKLIYDYFKSKQDLFKAYLFDQDFWIAHEPGLDDIIEAAKQDDAKSLAKDLIFRLLNRFYQNPEMQQMIHWEISESNPIGRGISDQRERIGEEMLALTDNHFRGSNVNFRAVEAILIAGIYYMVLHGRINGSTFCSLDINRKEHFLIFENTLNQIVDWAYYFGKSKQTD